MHDPLQAMRQLLVAKPTPEVVRERSRTNPIDEANRSEGHEGDGPAAEPDGNSARTRGDRPHDTLDGNVPCGTHIGRMRPGSSPTGLPGAPVFSNRRPARAAHQTIGRCSRTASIIAGERRSGGVARAPPLSPRPG